MFCIYNWFIALLHIKRIIAWLLIELVCSGPKSISKFHQSIFSIGFSGCKCSGGWHAFLWKFQFAVYRVLLQMFTVNFPPIHGTDTVQNISMSFPLVLFIILIDSKCHSVLILKFATLRAVNSSLFEAIRAEMEKNIEGDEYLDYLDEKLAWGWNFRAVPLAHRSFMIRRVACFNGRIPVDPTNSSVRLPCLQRSLGSDRWRRIRFPESG